MRSLLLMAPYVTVLVFSCSRTPPAATIEDRRDECSLNGILPPRIVCAAYLRDGDDGPAKGVYPMVGRGHEACLVPFGLLRSKGCGGEHEAYQPPRVGLYTCHGRLVNMSSFAS